MGMTTGGDAGGLNSEPNVIPMIDILLVLLIIFMITLPLSRMAIDVQVPPLETQPSPPTTQIVLNILEDGNYEINGQPVPPGQLDTQIHAIYDSRPAKLIFIKSHPNRTYQEWIRASDIVRGAGVQVIGFTPRAADGT
jgi:biopolymer transport protein ExbD